MFGEEDSSRPGSPGSRQSSRGAAALMFGEVDDLPMIAVSEDGIDEEMDEK
jgi:hypothetical protein